MIYNPENFYRCTIIRGKSTKDLDNLLPTYASIIDEICPCTRKEFKELFNERLSKVLSESNSKTLDNHRTEIAGKLFGMYFVLLDKVFISERTLKFLEDADQPAFFKDLCFKFQFPNGMDKSNKYFENMDNKISFRPFPFILELLLLSKLKSTFLRLGDIYYYVLNSLQVLQGTIEPEIVLHQIITDREDNVDVNVGKFYPGKQSSYWKQHLKEQMNLLELSNLIRINESIVSLNVSEMETIEHFAKHWDKKPFFNMYKFDLSTPESRKNFQKEWDIYFSQINEDKPFTTDLSALIKSTEKETHTDTTVTTLIEKPLKEFTNNELGDEGEFYVLNLEKERVSTFDKSLTRKVLHLGKTRGLGYDIQSVVAKPGDFAEFVRYIEVKSTKRVTPPDFTSDKFSDSINLTRNEFIASKQHGDSYFIYRVYFVPGKVIISIIQNPNLKNDEQKLTIKPVAYRLEFSNEAIDLKVENERVV